MKTNFNTVEDLLADESFLAWYHRTDETAVQYWEQWMNADPVHRQLAQEAIAFLKNMQLEEKSLSGEQVNAAADRLLQRIAVAKKIEYSTGKIKNHGLMLGTH